MINGIAGFNNDLIAYLFFRLSSLVVLVVTCLCNIVIVSADIITVDDDGPADFSTIQEAIDWSWHGDTIWVSPGYYNESIVFNSRAITLTSLDPNDPITVAATKIAATSDYGVTFDFNEGPDSVLAGFHLTGGGIQCIATSPTISKNTIRTSARRGIDGSFGAAPDVLENTIIHGYEEGIYGCSGQIYGNTIFDNNETGIFRCNGPISFNTISGNGTANPDFGGGLSECHGPISDNTITENRALSRGGGLYDCDGLIQNNQITDNRVYGSILTYGGGLDRCSGTISGNTIFNNQADGSNGRGGGLSDCEALIQYNQITDNVASREGGGLYGCAGDILDNEITGNLVQSLSIVYGGGLWGCSGLVSRNVISDNQAISTSNDSYGGGMYDCDGNILDNQISGNLAQGSSTTQGGGLWGCFGTVSGNVISDNQCISTASSCFGGGLYDCDGTIHDNQISGNLAQGNSTTGGGGLRSCSGSITMNVISGNRVVSTNGNGYGGGLYSCVQVHNNTIVANQVVATQDGFGGGVYNSNTPTRNNILAYNTAGSGGGGIYGASQNSYNLFWGNSSNFGGGSFAKTGDMLANPLFLQVGQWDDNGTPADYTDDIWTDGDYHLKSEGGRWTETGWVIDTVSSPAIDAGDPADPVSDEPEPHGDRINMGAYGGSDQASKSPGSGVPSGIPGPVENFAVHGGHQQIEITWDPPLDDGDLPILSYDIYRGNAPGSLAAIGQVPAGTTNLIDTDVIRGNTYYYAVSATNSFDEGPQAGPSSRLADWHDFDLNGDGVINLVDLSFMAGAWLWTADW